MGHVGHRSESPLAPTDGGFRFSNAHIARHGRIARCLSSTQTVGSLRPQLYRDQFVGGAADLLALMLGIAHIRPLLLQIFVGCELDGAGGDPHVRGRAQLRRSRSSSPMAMSRSSQFVPDASRQTNASRSQLNAKASNRRKSPPCVAWNANF